MRGSKSKLGSRSSFDLRSLERESTASPSLNFQKQSAQIAHGRLQPRWFQSEAVGCWDSASAGGNITYGSWRQNPQYSFELKSNIDYLPDDVEGARVTVLLVRTGASLTQDRGSRPRIGFYVARRPNSTSSEIQVIIVQLPHSIPLSTGPEMHSIVE